MFLSNQDGQKDAASEGSGPVPMTATDTTREASVSDPKASGVNPETSGLASEVTVPDPDAPTKSLAGSSTERGFAVDFEKIYKYPSFSSRGGHGPELSAAEYFSSSNFHLFTSIGPIPNLHLHDILNFSFIFEIVSLYP